MIGEKNDKKYSTQDAILKFQQILNTVIKRNV